MMIEWLETRHLLAIAADLDFRVLGEAPADGQLLVAPIAGGKVLAVGTNRSTRLNADGSFDGTFRDSGFRASPPPGTIFEMFSAVQSSPRVISAGTTLRTDNGGSTNTLVLRAIRLSNGRPDSTFGDNGLITIELESVLPGHELNGIGVGPMTVTSDGGLAVFVRQELRANGSTVRQFAAVLYKLDANGAIDPSFGDAGHVTFGDDSLTTAGGIQVDSQGRILVQYVDDSGPFLTRLNSDGSTDTSFGDAGTVELPSGFFGTSYSDFTLLPDGRMLFVTRIEDDLASATRVVRHNADGSRDSTFGDPNVDRFIDEVILSIAVDAQGRTIGNTQTALFRLTPGGVFDTTFDGDGVAMLPREVPTSGGALAVDSSGRALLGTPQLVTRFTERANVVIAPNAVLRIDGAEGADTLNVSRSGSTLTVQLNNDTTTFDAALVESLSVFVGTGDSAINLDVDVPSYVSSLSGDDSITTGSGNDTIDAGSGNDTTDSGAGADRVLARGGANLVHGGSGNDIIYADEANDTLHGGEGNDLLDGGGAADSLIGDAGKDRLVGGFGRDALDGGLGNDRLFGGNDNDTLLGGAGSDTLDGGENRDRIEAGDDHDLILIADMLRDTLDAGGGRDRAEIDAALDLVEDLETIL